MRVVKGLPPLFDEIDAAFNVRGKPVFFAWGDTIYNPAGLVVTPPIAAHERVHGDRQGKDIAAWWRRYIAEPDFRLCEEIPAHIAEFKAMCEWKAHSWVSQRNMRRTYSSVLAKKLAAPLYGRLISVDDAKSLILAA